MNILGLNFGHDAAATVIRDGKIASYALRERLVRTKHAVSLDERTIRAALDDAGILAENIDFVAITSSQGVELVVDNPAAVSIAYSAHPAHHELGTMYPLLQAQGVSVTSLCSSRMASWIYDTDPASWVGQLWRELFPEHGKFTRESLPVIAPYLDAHANISPWQQQQTLAQIQAGNYFRQIIDDPNGRIRKGFYYPATVTLFGRTIPGYFVDHHACHAASVYYQSPFASAAVLTHDGAGTPSGSTTGMMYFGQGNKIFPLAPHFLTIGDFYHNVGRVLGLGRMGAPGKLMGLAAYGKPQYFDSRYVGNFFDVCQKTGTQGNHVETWINQSLKIAHALGFDTRLVGSPENVTNKVSVDIAASAQKIFEETMFAAQETLWHILHAADKVTPNLCLSGGTALNCPANSRIFCEGKFNDVFIEPTCDDSGLAIGAALYVHFNILDAVREPQQGALPSPYLGRTYDTSRDAVDKLIAMLAVPLKTEAIADAPRDAAELLASNKIVAWFEGRSEAGPRALGHRSILADPRLADNWARVNRVKTRELWRPFAPVVLESEAARWFGNAPVPAPYMLFNADVRSADIPAVTHIDGTARIQTITETAGGYFRVLKAFFALTSVPVLMNTSFNGPAEPIVESPEDALSFFANSQLDALYMDGLKVTRVSK